MTTFTSPFGAGFSPITGWNRMGQVPIPYKTATAFTLTTGGGARTLTAAEILGGLLIINCDDAQTATLPTATLLNAAIQGAVAGASFDFDLINVGDTTVTVAVGTGGSLVVGNSKSSVATVVAQASKRFTIRVTGVTQQGDASDAYIVYGHGSIAAANA
jgi:hypothetical protein